MSSTGMPAELLSGSDTQLEYNNDVSWWYRIFSGFLPLYMGIF